MLLSIQKQLGIFITIPEKIKSRNFPHLDLTSNTFEWERPSLRYIETKPDLQTYNAPLRFNQILTEQTHSPIGLSHPYFRLGITSSLSRFASTYTFYFDSIPEIPLSFHEAKVHPELQRCPLFGATSSCINIIIKKKKKKNM